MLAGFRVWADPTRSLDSGSYFGLASGTLHVKLIEPEEGTTMETIGIIHTYSTTLIP